LEGVASKNKFAPRPPLVPRGRDQRVVDKGKGKVDEATKRELRRKQLCYTCKEPWELGHRCMGKGKIQYIEVLSNSEEEDDVGHLQNMEVAQAKEEHTHGEEEEESMLKQTRIKKVVITSISGVPKFSTFRMRGVLQGQRITVLIDGGASHNFIDAALVNMRHLPIVEFEGFLVEVAGGHIMPCDRYIPQMSLTLGRYNLTQDLYVMDLPDKNVILGVQWLSTLGSITTNYKTMEMSFNFDEGKRVTLKGMSENAPRVFSARCMEAIFRHEDMDYAAECLVSVQTANEGYQHYPHDIQRILGKHEKVFGQIPPGQPLDRRFEHTICRFSEVL
jgi:hypothetical protein